MSEMIERVAEALAKRFMGEIEERLCVSFAETGVSLPDMRVWRSYAKAAIEAMPASTYEMQLAGQQVVNLSDEPGRYSYISRDETQEIWQAMVDEAMK